MTPMKEFHDPASTADLLASIGVDPAAGLSRDDAMVRRTMYGVNRVTPPVNCPSWVCCLLPCLLRTPSMRAYQRAVPQEATVRRAKGGPARSAASTVGHTHGSQEIARVPGPLRRMDAASLVYGDIVQLVAGDVVGADLRVLECSADCVVDQSTLVGGHGGGSGDGDVEEALHQEDGDDSDYALEAGRLPRRLKRVGVVPTDTRDPLVSANALLMTTTILRGNAVGVVIATGDATLWGELMAQGRWPIAASSASRHRQRDGEQHALMSVA